MVCRGKTHHFVFTYNPPIVMLTQIRRSYNKVDLYSADKR